MERLQDRIEEYVQKEASPSKQAHANELMGYQNAFDSRNLEGAQTLGELRHP